MVAVETKTAPHTTQKSTFVSIAAMHSRLPQRVKKRRKTMSAVTAAFAESGHGGHRERIPLRLGQCQPPIISRPKLAPPRTILDVPIRGLRRPRWGGCVVGLAILLILL
jgi:hypothetical protein